MLTILHALGMFIVDLFIPAAASNVRSYLVIIGGVFRKNSSNVFCVEHDQMVCALADPLQNISAPADLPLPI